MDYLLQFQLGFSFLYYILNFFFFGLFFQHHSAILSLALILVLGAPLKQKVCKVFLSGLMLTYMRNILVN